jgi:hypothetical protein
MCFLAVFSLKFALSCIRMAILAFAYVLAQNKGISERFVFVCENKEKNTRIWVWGGT